jgi:hypothetical protein
VPNGDIGSAFYSVARIAFERVAIFDEDPADCYTVITQHGGNWRWEPSAILGVRVAAGPARSGNRIARRSQ